MGARGIVRAWGLDEAVPRGCPATGEYASSILAWRVPAGARRRYGQRVTTPTAPAAADPAGPTALEVAGPTSRRKVLAWGMWDWGSQPFNTVITTFVFSVYVTSESFGATNATSTALAISTAISGLFVALLAPVLGQNSDRSGKTVRNLRIQTWLLAGLSASLYVVKPEPAFLWVGLVLLGVGSVVSEIAGVNYNATIDQVATGKTVGRVSGFGWGMGYLGGIIVLLLLYFLLIQPDVGLFGVTDTDGLDIRVSMIICGLWTLLFTIPAFLVLKDRPRRTRSPGRGRDVLPAGRGARSRACGAPPGTPCTSCSPPRSTATASPASSPSAPSSPSGTFGLSAGDVIVFGAAANIVAGHRDDGVRAPRRPDRAEARHPRLAGLPRRAREP